MQTQEKAGLGKVIGDFLVWATDHITVNGLLVFLVVAALVFVGWKVSLVFGPQKICWRCGGDGFTKGWFGGKRTCSRCNGDGLRYRVGARRD